jgi:hypothetical protein
VLALLAAAAAAGAPAKKLIEFGWDEPGPAFMRRHIAQMEATPFDGCAYHLDYTRPDGSSGNFTWEAWGRRTFTRAELQASIDDLEATPFRRFKYNFLRFNTTPADLDWFDDYGAVVANARLAAEVARQAGSRGIALDPEQYRAPLFDYAKQRDAASKPWESYAAQARRRGREVMAAFEDGYPGLTVFLTFGYSMPWSQTRGGRVPLSRCSYGLLAPFLDGMVEAAAGSTRIVDGYELSYGETKPQRFKAAYREMKQTLLPIVADPAKYHQVFSFGFAVWLDYESGKHGWNTSRPDRNYLSPRRLRSTVRKALETADEYVWVYSETPRWWTESGSPLKLPPAYPDALRGARRNLAAD